MATLSRLAVILPDSGGGGIFQFYNQLIQEMEKHVEVLVVLADPFETPCEALPFRNVQFVRQEDSEPIRQTLLRGPLSAYPQLTRMLAVAYAAWDKVCAWGPDIAEFCDWPLTFAPAVLTQTLPYVVQCHGSIGQIAEHDPQHGQSLEAHMVQMLEPQLLAAAHHVQSYSQANADFWRNTANRPVSMIRPAMALPTSSHGHDIRPDAAVFGRLQRWKGPHVLCEALRTLGARAPEITWYGGVKPWGTENLSAERHLAGAYPEVWGRSLHHHGPVDRQSVADIQARSLFNVIPSTWDVFNFTAVEAMASGRPTIVSTGAGASELIRDGDNGFVHRNEDPVSLAAAIDRVLSMTESQRSEIGAAGQATIRDELDPARIAAQRLAAYSKAIDDFATSPPRRPNAWLCELLHRQPAQHFDREDILETVPIRLLARHLKTRLTRRLQAKLTRK